MLLLYAFTLVLIGTEKSTKVHLYYCMKNCAQSGKQLQKSILNIVKHYQVSGKIIFFHCVRLFLPTR